MEHHDYSSQEEMIRQRGANAIVGSLVADAATMGLHWIYDTSKIDSLLQEEKKENPEFFEPPSCPFYTYESGRNTPYGEQTFALLQHVAKTGRLDPTAYALSTWDTFGEDSGYTGRLDHSLKGFIENWKLGKRWPEVGSDDEQANGLAKVAPVVALYAGKPEMLARVEEAIRVTQNSDKAVAMGLAGARITEGVILGASPVDAVIAALQELRNPQRRNPNVLDGLVAEKIEEALKLKDQPHNAAVKTLGLSCSFPFSLQNGVQLFSRTSTEGGDYATAVRASILAGGDNASRLLFIGAVLGATSSNIPREWKAKTNTIHQIEELAQQLVTHRE